MTRSNHGALLLLVGLVATGCSAGGGDGVQSRPAVCSSIEGPQAAVTDLRNVDVSAEGVAALQAKVGAVGADVQQVADDAAAQYPGQVDQLKADFDAVGSAAGSAQVTPAAAALSAVATSVSTLADEVRPFSADVASTCWPNGRLDRRAEEAPGTWSTRHRHRHAPCPRCTEPPSSTAADGSWPFSRRRRRHGDTRETRGATENRLGGDRPGHHPGHHPGRPAHRPDQRC